MIRMLLLLILTTVPATMALAQTDKSMTYFVPASVPWKAGKDAKSALLDGSPSKAGPFTYRLMVADGFRMEPHSHGHVEYITILSGTLYMGTGEKFDEKQARELPAGSFAVMPAGTPHFLWVKGETVIQVHGNGPTSTTQIKPADAPGIPATKPDGQKP